MSDLLIKLYALPQPTSPQDNITIRRAFAAELFGPTGVAASERNHGVGTALLLAALRDMGAQGYAYAIIGRPDSAEFYRKHAGAIEIPDSDPGFYRGLIKQI